MAGQEPAKPVSLFYSYSHQDEDLRRKLEIQLSVLRRGGLIAEWHDRKLEPGDAWKEEIDRHLTSADIVLLLVSADFVNSDYCWGEEMTKALARHERGVALVIPVILRHCRWQITPLGALQVVPRDARPVTAWPDQDEAFTDVVTAIERAVEKVRNRVASEPDKPSPALEPGTIFRDIDTPWCPEMVVIPAGSFLMGSPESEVGHGRDESPQHEVWFASPYALGKYPLTFAEYDYFCAETDWERPDDRGWGRGQRPVINVSWRDAQRYCRWLSERTEATYRLPSEAEWEYACRAGTNSPFWTGATISTEQANYNAIHTEPPAEGRFRGRSTRVDTFGANPWGLHDVHGNVWEWCEDPCHRDYCGAPVDGSVWLTGREIPYVLRGGSWLADSWCIRAAHRGGLHLNGRKDDLGFRLARTLTY